MAPRCEQGSELVDKSVDLPCTSYFRYNLKAYLPVRASFGFMDVLKGATGGKAFAQLVSGQSIHICCRFADSRMVKRSSTTGMRSPKELSWKQAPRAKHLR